MIVPSTLNTVEREPAKKKMRMSLLSQRSIPSLSHQGISSFGTGDLLEAEELFSEALLRVATYQRNNELSTSTDKSQEDVSIKKSVPRLDNESLIDSNMHSSRTSIEYDEGMMIYNVALPLHENAPQDLSEPILSYNIGQIYVQRSLFIRARTWFDNVLIRVNPATKEGAIVFFKTLHGLGYCHYRSGNTGMALVAYRQALAAVQQGNLGRLHEAATRNCIGVVLFNQRNAFHEIMNEFATSLMYYQNCPSASEVAIATVMNNMGRLLYIRGDYEDALNVYFESLRLRKVHLGKISIDVAATAYNIGQTYQQLKRYEEAIESYSDFLKITSKVIGENAKDTALAYSGMAEIYLAKRDLKMARYYAIRALEVQQASIEPSNQDIATTLNRLGNLCYEMEDYNSALHYYQKGLVLERAIYSPGHEHIIITMTNIAHIYKQLGKYPNALAAYKHVHQMHVAKSGSDSIAAADSMSSIGLMEYYMHDYESSFESYQEALRVRRQHYGTDDHIDVASTLNSVGLVLFKQEMFDLSKRCFIESLRIRRNILGKNHQDVAILWYNIATIHFETGEEDVAIQMYKETLRVERVSLGDDHPDVILTLQHIGQVHQQLGHTEMALEYYEEALQKERKRDNRPGTMIRILNLLGNAHLQLGRTRDMMKCYVEASTLREMDAARETNSLVIAGFNLYGLSKISPPCAPVA